MRSMWKPYVYTRGIGSKVKKKSWKRSTAEVVALLDYLEVVLAFVHPKVG